MTEKLVTFRPFDDATLQALDAAHGDIRRVRGATPPAKSWQTGHVPEPPWEAVFRKPTTGESDNFEGSAHRDNARPGALRNLAKATIVGVSLDGKITVCSNREDPKSVREVRDAWDDLRAKHPGAHMAAQNDLMSLCGMAAEEEGKE